MFAFLLEVAIMADFGMEKSEDDKTPKVEIPTNLDAKTFVMGHGNIIGKNEEMTKVTYSMSDANLITKYATCT